MSFIDNGIHYNAESAKVGRLMGMSSRMATKSLSKLQPQQLQEGESQSHHIGQQRQDGQGSSYDDAPRIRTSASRI